MRQSQTSASSLPREEQSSLKPAEPRKEFKVKATTESARQAEKLIKSTYEKLQKLEADINRRKEQEAVLQQNLLGRISTRAVPGQALLAAPSGSATAQGSALPGSKQTEVQFENSPHPERLQPRLSNSVKHHSRNTSHRTTASVDDKK